MHGKPTKKTHHPHTGIRRPVCPERFSPAARAGLPPRNLVDAADYRGYRHRRSNPLPAMAAKSLDVKGDLAMKKRKRGRPRLQEPVRITPVFREKPDIPKLGRAVIALAEKMAEEMDKKEESHENSD